MASVIKERDFGPVPISADALGEFYLNKLTAIEEQYHKPPDTVLLDAKFKTSSGDVRFELPMALTATERTTKEERKTAFGNMLSPLSSQGPFAVEDLLGKGEGMGGTCERFYSLYRP
ncbi:hypothetical protein BDV39DRAFT_202873 [Aspergillus sergii]|uniref:Uncharacterized protein n=1 Tax=Aspergillus sergii TaxID=1034303 RepID=A0A5N6XDH6_9EURO|nr:hypothetical protein BDV39DRAFT_202873 [Aspergillus sergii]